MTPSTPDESALAFIDTETLGLDARYHPIWEIAVIVDGRETVWQQKVSYSALQRADPVALDINRFHERYDRLTALPRAESIRRFMDLVRGRHLVGAVVSFDEERLRSQWHQASSISGIPVSYHYHVIDVEAIAVGALAARGELPPLPWKSHDVSDALGVELTDGHVEHNALDDARWARLMWLAATRRWKT